MSRDPTDNILFPRVAQIVPCTESEGPGRRFALWFQGCPLRCPGCCNPEMLSFEGGALTPLREILRQVEHARRQHAIEGITLLGGEPIAHAGAAAALARQVRALGLSVMVFSGFTIEEILASRDSDAAELLRHTDILVDGPYIRELPEARRRWIGSANQRVHFLTDCYGPDDWCWRQPNTLDIRLEDGVLSVNGFPAANLVGLWRRPKKVGSP
jgi:anaerobic ribonucleoside-triphosphate reductase activating protein